MRSPAINRIDNLPFNLILNLKVLCHETPKAVELQTLLKGSSCTNPFKILIPFFILVGIFLGFPEGFWANPRNVKQIPKIFVFQATNLLLQYNIIQTIFLILNCRPSCNQDLTKNTNSSLFECHVPVPLNRFLIVLYTGRGVGMRPN